MSWPTSKSWFRPLGLVVGISLLVAATGYALGNVDFSMLGQAHPAWLIVLGLCVLVNLWLSALLFWVIGLSFDARPPVSLMRMLELISASALINHLPLGWPGPVARSVYLKQHHQMPVSQSILILLMVLGMTGISAAAALALAVGRDHGWIAWSMGALLGLICLTHGPLLQKLLRRRIVAGWSWWPIKWMDMLSNALRLWLAFAIVGSPIGFLDALALAGLDMVVSMVAITPNGLGASEWVVGLCSQWLAIAQGPVGILAKLVDRTVNILVTVLAGLIGMRGLIQRRPS